MATKVKKPLKISPSNHYLDSIIILQECSLEFYRIPSNKNDASKNMAFMGN